MSVTFLRRWGYSWMAVSWVVAFVGVHFGITLLTLLGGYFLGVTVTMVAEFEDELKRQIKPPTQNL